MLYLQRNSECPYLPADSPSSFIRAKAELGVHTLQQPSERWDGGHSNSVEACVAATTEGGFPFIFLHVSVLYHVPWTPRKYPCVIKTRHTLVTELQKAPFTVRDKTSERRGLSSKFCAAEACKGLGPDALPKHLCTTKSYLVHI